MCGLPLQRGRIMYFESVGSHNQLCTFHTLINLLVTSLFYIQARHRMIEGRKHGALRPQKPLRLIRDGEVRGGGGREILYLTPTRCHHQNDCVKVGSCVSQFNVSLIVWEKSQDSVHKPQVLKRRGSRSGSNRCPAAYQPDGSS